MKELNVVTFVAKQCADYANFLRRSMEMFKSGLVDINYLYVESNGGDDKPLEGWECIGQTPSIGHNSGNHGVALDYAYKYAQERPEANWIFVDADIAITYIDWDLAITGRLEKVDCTGFAYGSDGPRYRDFPCVFFIAMNDNFLKCDVNWAPALVPGQKAVRRVEIKSEDMAAATGLKIGEQIKCDTGWHIPFDTKKHLRGWGWLERTLGCEKGRLLPYKDKHMRKTCDTRREHMAEWHLDGKLFGTHKQASRSMAFDSDWGKIWRWRINEYCKSEHGKELK